MARVKPDFALTLNPREVTEAFEVPLEFLMKPDNHQRKTRDWKGIAARILRDAVREALHLGHHRGYFAQSLRAGLRRMIRPIFTEIGLFLTPFVLYARFLWRRAPAWCSRRHGRRRASPCWSSSRWCWWSASFLVLAQFSGAPPGSTYVPAHVENGKFVPGDDAVTTAAQLGDAAWLKDGEVARLLALLDRDGEEARVVGGAVRNALLRLPVGEIDVATTAVPDEVVRRVEAAGWKAVPTGIEHGTVTVVIDGQPFEVTTLRQDVETFGRKAKVVFGRDWRADAERRDFTINALSASADGTVFDYVGGLADIAARRVRFIGDPQQRIAEDYLRILRFFRFHAYYARGRARCRRLARLHRRARRPRHAVARAGADGAAEAAGRAARRADARGHGRDRAPRPSARRRAVRRELRQHGRRSKRRLARADAVRRLGALGVMVTRGCRAAVAAAAPLQRRSRAAHAALERWWRISPAAGEQAARALLYHLGPQSFTDRVLLAWARAAMRARPTATWRALASCRSAGRRRCFRSRPPTSPAAAWPPGPALGAAMRAAKEAWIAADFPADSAAIEAIAERAARARYGRRLAADNARARSERSRRRLPCAIS